MEIKKNRHKYLLQYHIIFVCKYRKKLLVSKQISDDIKQFSNGICKKLPKLKQVRAKLHRKFAGQIKSAAVSQVPSGKYYVSVLVETDHAALPKTERKIGLDLGIKDICIMGSSQRCCVIV